jgi:integrase
MLNYAIDDGVIVHNPADRLGRQLRLTSSPTERDTEIKAFDLLQLRRFLDAAAMSELEYYPLFFTLARAGLRLGEAFALTWEDLDFESRQIRVEQAVSAGSLSTTKSRRSRDVDMSAQLRDVLRGLKSSRLEQALLERRDPMPSWVFVNSAGQRMNQSRVSKVFKRVLKAAELPMYYTPHCLRHTFASLFLQQGESPAYVQRQLGHASIQLTVDTYGRWLPMGSGGRSPRRRKHW